jgi:hypothetical protein
MLGVQAKLDRVIEQLTGLHREVLDLQGSGRLELVALGNPEGTEFRVALNPDWDERKTLRWGVIVGEIIHDLRSALDHMVWELVAANGGTPDRCTSFPICSVEPVNGFRSFALANPQSKRHGPLVGLTPDHVSFVESCQPYHGGNCKRLELINALWNTDKHRHLIAAPVLIGDPTFDVVGGVIEDREPYIKPDEDPSLVLHVRPTGPARPQLKVSYDIGPDLAFGISTPLPGMPVVDVLSGLVAYVLDDVCGRLIT